ncbi:hypothetical protein JOF48_000305 [Arthrobacter stackebrandtii]|uniref:Uncharacterized protein n=1 Tax=Arthrobacter stackebrandtii TaxID=272161 RepID=A0ABS4YRT1_9MICC|nr:hypothetical protein [Arthrobacter stackebrandtii]MBP2411506.1 hypothetical protein [Arthrobacter stackebrandtii]PYH00222.1 hypothetical protein CVV67_10685 [Arthrobacter stackebrandtii]
MENKVIEDSVLSSHTRRRVVKGAAWSLPVIAVAVAAPAASASDPVFQERYIFSGGTNTNTVEGVIQEVTLTGGNFTLEGPAGTTTGEITLVATFPDGYTEWTAVAELYSWTWVETEEDGLKVVTFSHPGMTVTTAGTPVSAWFAGIVLLGSGATKRNNATFAYSCTNFTGGGLFAPN